MLGALPGAASADTFTVTTTADSGGDSLRAAVASATASDPTPDEIQFDPSLAGATITLATPLAIDTTTSGALTVNPTSSVVSGISVSGDNNSALLDITAGIVTLNRLTLRDAVGAAGAAAAGGSVDGGAGGSAAIFNGAGATLTISGSTLTGLVGGDGGDGGSGSFGGTGQGAGGGGGGAVMSAGTLTLTASTLTASRGGHGGTGGGGAGGGDHSGGGGGSGGGAMTNLNGGTLAIENSTVTQNRGGDGGAGGVATVFGGGGGGGAAGSAVLNASGGSLTIESSTIAANDSGLGNEGGDGTAGGSTAGSAGGGGGPGAGGGGGATAASAIGAGGSGPAGTGGGTNGPSTGGGGGAGLGGAGGPGDGGGGGGFIASAGGDGGGLAGDGGGGTGSSAGAGGGGGGIGGGGGGGYQPGATGGGAFGGGGATVTGGVTVAATPGTDGGGGGGGQGAGVANPQPLGGAGSRGGGGVATGIGGTVSITSSILSDSAASGVGAQPDCRGTITAGGSGIVEDVTGCTRPGGDTRSGDPGLSSAGLANNGGPTQTIALTTGSQAINNGTNASGFIFDQRGSGFSRVIGAGADVGAFELQTELSRGPTSLAFGSRDVDDGATAAQESTVTNSGNAPVTVTGVSVGGADAAHFERLTGQGTDCTDTTTLAIGETCKVRARLDPSTVGAKSATITVSSNAPDVTVALSGTGIQTELSPSPTGLAFGSQDVDDGPAAAHESTVTNSGTESVTLTGVSLGGAGAAHFERLTGQPADCTDTTALAAGETCKLRARFDPSTVGSKAATITVSSNAPDVTVALSGTGIQTELSGTTTSLAFGPQDIDDGPTAAHESTVTNSGTELVALTGLSVDGADAAHFERLTGQPSDCANTTTLLAGATCKLRFRFDPSSVGSKSATITVSSNVPDVTVALTGTGTQTELSPGLTGLAFGSQDVDGGPTAGQESTVTNSGTEPVTVTGVSLGGADAAHFERLTGQPTDCTGTTTLAIGETCKLRARFDPSSAGGRSATITVTSNAPDVTVALSGTGTQTAALLAPTAVGDSMTVDQDTTGRFDVLANDNFPNGTPKRVASITDPAHGRAAIAADGATVTYEPARGYCNSRGGAPRDAFRYALAGGSAATVTVQVVCAPRPGAARIVHPVVRVGSGGAPLLLACKGQPGDRCAGRLWLESTSRGSRVSPSARSRAVSFSLVAGKSRRCRVALPAGTRAQLDRRGKSVVRGVAQVRGGETTRRMLTLLAR